jgi:hypothetical protein
MYQGKIPVTTFTSIVIDKQNIFTVLKGQETSSFIS